MDKPILASGQMLSIGQLVGSDGFNLSQQQLPASFGDTGQVIDNLQPSVAVVYMIRSDALRRLRSRQWQLVSLMAPMQCSLLRET